MKKKFEDLTIKEIGNFCEKYAEKDCSGCPILKVLKYISICPSANIPVSILNKEVEIYD